MPPLASEARRQLENVCIQARDLAQTAARAALQKRAVDAAEPFAHFSALDRELRTRLRARGRQVGDVRRANKTQSIDQLTQELAYEYWHRMLFARFLAENNLLMHPDGVPVSLADCDELAKQEGAANGYVLAARYASRMLPQIFRTDDVLLEVEFPVNDRLPLEKLLASLPASTFTADDSLGWVYQFWQSKKKKEVNDSGEKIDGRTLPAVTQLFTEHYMVQFLLHNTIGAWWCARHNIEGPPGGAGVPAGKAPVEMEYLRWRDDGTPAAGKFEGWPKTLKEFTMLDPCCGSGHFLVSAFNLLVPLRMHDEGLSAREACDAVLQENLFGLELDPRCTQIAAFALALAAWKYPDEDGRPLGYRQLPPLNIACSGQGVVGKREEWQSLANGNRNLGITLGDLYDLFLKAPDLGSLIEPRTVLGAPGITGTLADVQPLLAKALAKQQGDADLAALGVAAQGIAKAAELLSGRYTFVTTNVPYLGRSKQADVVKSYLEDHYTLGKADLATAFVLRCLDLCSPAGTTALVTPQNWLFLTTYKKLREALLKEQTWNLVARLGARAFETISGEVVNIILLALSALPPTEASLLAGVDVAEAQTPGEKAARLANRETTPVQPVRQVDQLRNPDAVIQFKAVHEGNYLSDFADCFQGISTEDNPHFVCKFWEVPNSNKFTRLQTTPMEDRTVAGCDSLVRSELLEESFGQGTIRGRSAWGRQGLAMSQTGILRFVRYTGVVFTNTTPVLIPKSPDTLPAIWAFAQSGEFVKQIRASNQKLSIDNGYVTKVPFDLAHWQRIAAKKYPHGLPEPHSDDPTQWLFKGDIANSTDPLQVAVARLLGYRWPEQPKEIDAIDKLADKDGIVCIPAVRGKAPAAERLL
ncbi:MAG TPA: DNA methyltransferase, partial [Gemmataceae bacterium]|nr:DNA methyltransferase [Gemmataceae bacterium]